VWTLEDQKIILLVLQKLKKQEAWESVIRGSHVIDPLTKDKMAKKMMLERFQSEV